MFKIGDKFRVHLDDMDEGEYQYGVVTKIKLIDDTLYYYDDNMLIWTSNDADFYEYSREIYLVLTKEVLLGIYDNEFLAIQAVQNNSILYEDVIFIKVPMNKPIKNYVKV